jgi:hypothetical protein
MCYWLQALYEGNLSDMYHVSPTSILRHCTNRHIYIYIYGVFVFGIRIRMYSNTNSKVFVFVFAFEHFLKYSDSEYFHEHFMKTCENIRHKCPLITEAVILLHMVAITARQLVV